MIRRFPDTENLSPTPELAGVIFVPNNPDIYPPETIASHPLDISLLNADGSRRNVQAYHIGFLKREIETVGGMKFSADPSNSHSFPLFLIREKHARHFSVLMAASATNAKTAIGSNKPLVDYALNSGGWDYREDNVDARLDRFTVLSGEFNNLVQPTWLQQAVNRVRGLVHMDPLPPEPFGLPTTILQNVANVAAKLDEYIENNIAK